MSSYFYDDLKPKGLDPIPIIRKEINIMFTWKWLFEQAAKLLLPIVEMLTPEIKTELENFVLALYQKSVLTPNQWDDFLIKMLADLLNIKLP